jgi:hypothetical protein
MARPWELNPEKAFYLRHSSSFTFSSGKDETVLSGFDHMNTTNNVDCPIDEKWDNMQNDQRWLKRVTV